MDQNMLSMFLMYGALLVVLYFLILHPQRKKEKDHENLLKKLEPGDKVVTIGGLYGTITRVEDTIVTLQIAENVRVRVAKAAINRKVEE